MKRTYTTIITNFFIRLTAGIGCSSAPGPPKLPRGKGGSANNGFGPIP